MLGVTPDWAPHSSGARSHSLRVLNHGDIPPPNTQNLLTKVDYCSILPQEMDSQYAVISIDVSNVKIELGIKCLDLHLSISSMSDV